MASPSMENAISGFSASIAVTTSPGIKRTTRKTMMVTRNMVGTTNSNLLIT